MYLYSLTPTPAIDLAGAASHVTVDATVREISAEHDRYTVTAYYYDDLGDPTALYSNTTSLMGFTSYTFRFYLEKSVLSGVLAGRYESTVYVEITSENNGSDGGSVKLTDSSYAAPTVSAAISFSNTLTVGGTEYGIQTKTKATADFSASSAGKFPIDSYCVYVNSISGGYTVSGTSATSPAIDRYGTKTVIYGVYSGKKWFYGYWDGTIDVLPYTGPSIVRLPSEDGIVCRRAASDGSYAANGRYLFVGCKKNYSPLNAAGADRNAATVEVCISENGGAFGEWSAISGAGGSDTVEYTSASPVLPSASSTYEVKIRITDAAGSAVTVFRIGTASFPLHLAAGGRSVGIGQVASDRNDRVDFGWPVYFNGGIGKRVVFESATAKAGGSVITSAEGDLAGVDRYSLFLVDKALYTSSPVTGGFEACRCDNGSVRGFTYSAATNEITVGTNGLRSIIALL
ncbi:MAG: hypothetical protein J5940_01205 [Clostridia bacterium]|nr:hypothetical protein [Clostridia bacterium]